MRYLPSWKISLLFLSLALVMVSGRLAQHQFDISTFIVAGSDFVDPAHTPAPVAIHSAQGYDGQFFYRYAIAPFNFSKSAHGVTVDHPSYRMQRIAYPFLAWVLALGGIPGLVPFALVLLNILAFVGISFYAGKLIIYINGPPLNRFYPLFLCGIYMCISRDLSEVLELFFFTGAIYYLFRTRYMLFALFTTFTLLSRETSVIAFIPIVFAMVLQVSRKKVNPSVLICLFIPFLVFAIWKVYIYSRIPSVADAAAGYGSLGLPFRGIIMGLRQNLVISGFTDLAQLAFWLAYVFWQLAFVFIVFRNTSFRHLFRIDNGSILKLVYLFWLLFAICFADTIYCDDWGFVRIFSLWNMVGFLILSLEQKSLGRLFTAYSVVLAGLTIARLIIRV